MMVIGPYVLESMLAKVVGVLLFFLFPTSNCCRPEDLSRCLVWHAVILTVVVVPVSDAHLSDHGARCGA